MKLHHDAGRARTDALIHNYAADRGKLPCRVDQVPSRLDARVLLGKGRRNLWGCPRGLEGSIG
eukprot:18557-Eustigmatos_ZCMA.PRE.1